MNGDLEKKKKKKARITSGENEEEDRISRLPDDLLHRILKFVDTKLGVQTSALSKRWKFVWTTLPFLKFEWDQRYSAANISNLSRHVLNHRNHQSQISSLEIAFLPTGLIVKFIEYAISHHVQCLNVQFRSDHKPYRLSNFSSNSIRKLILRMKPGDSLLESDSWNLPALSTLHFQCYVDYISILKWVEDKLLEQYLTCLPALRNLWLQHWDLQSFAFSLSELTTLVLRICKLINKVWNLPALQSLTLDDVEFPENTRDLFTALVNLQNLTLSYNKVTTHNCFITCPELVNLEIKTLYKHFYGIPKCTIVVFAPKLRNFTSDGIFPITFEDSKLDNVNVKLRGWTNDKYCTREELKECYRQFTIMLPGLGSAKILNLDLEVIEVT